MIDVFEVSKENRIYSRNWWIDFKSESGFDEVKIYSYPVFNLKHNSAFITYRIFTYNITQNSGFITCSFDKQPDGSWIKTSCSPVM
ncbi:hypothetical protein GCM10007384_28830 [Aquimarina muelleri]|uniref:Uncharacterized protein n=1 Tax=Aquimarina muelleri TaxID=279356 RepID=A0A918JY01_9FLAO|nr:hypothetical protein GCM10007384_28830 [Aquimarina muelleri]